MNAKISPPINNKDPYGQGNGLGGGGDDWNGPRTWYGKYGPGDNYCINTLKPFHVEASFPVQSASSKLKNSGMTVKLTQDLSSGTACTIEMNVGAGYSGINELSVSLTKGMNLVYSYWGGDGVDMGWLDGKGTDNKGGGCPAHVPDLSSYPSCKGTPRIYDLSVESLSTPMPPVPVPVPKPVSPPVPVPVPKPVSPPVPLPVPKPVSPPVPVKPVSPPVPLPVPSQQPVPSPSQQPVPSPSQQPVPSPSQQPLPSPSQQPVPSPSQQPLPSPSQQPIPSPSQQPVNQNKEVENDDDDDDDESSNQPPPSNYPTEKLIPYVDLYEDDIARAHSPTYMPVLTLQWKGKILSLYMKIYIYIYIYVCILNKNVILKKIVTFILHVMF
jgi:hypothetical protein